MNLQNLLKACWIAIGLGGMAASFPAQAEGLTGLLRSITSALPSPKAQPQPTSTMGIRGMDDGEQQASAGPASEDYALMEGWAASEQEASTAAKKRAIAARKVTLRATLAASPQETGK